MKVILQENIKGTGKKGAIVEVSDGYARNFLLPKKLAVEASKANVTAVKLAESAMLHKRDVEKEQAIQLGERIGKITVEVMAKAGENGKLFGSITNKEIADALLKQYKIDIDKKKIVMHEPIRATGEMQVDVKLYPEYSVKLNVTVSAQK